MLKRILDQKQKEVEQLYRQGFSYNVHVTERKLPSYPFLERIRQPKRSSALIAEVKKASPSKGVIRADFNPVEIAKAYEQGGADCLSVLTDQLFFQGNPSYIAQIKAEVGLPILRKDFIIDPIQVEESVQLGADAILLIAKALSPEHLFSLYRKAEELGLACLVEVSTQEEIEQLLATFTPQLLGINNRDLHTFETSAAVTKALRPLIPEDVLVISESGIHSAEIIQDLERCGVAGFLIGEYLMRQEHIQEAVQKLYA